ncbi:MAG: monovalent cation/H(+) antiporter subunit G [Acidimicrobiia bacterium]
MFGSIALDIITNILIMGLALEAALNRRRDTVPVLVALALVGFVGSAAVARFASVEPKDAGRIKTLEEVESEDAARLEAELADDRLEAEAPSGRGPGAEGGGTEMLDALAAISFVAGSFLTLAAGVGVLRFPDLLARMHTGAKPQVLGVLLALTGLALRLRVASAIWTLALVAIFQMLTAPVAAHLVARAGYRTREDLARSSRSGRTDGGPHTGRDRYEPRTGVATVLGMAGFSAKADARKQCNAISACSHEGFDQVQN